MACILEEGAGVKVPAELAKELIGEKGIVHFQPMGRAKMREWVKNNRKSPEDYLKDAELFEISINFIASLGQN